MPALDATGTTALKAEFAKEYGGMQLRTEVAEGIVKYLAGRGESIQRG